MQGLGHHRDPLASNSGSGSSSADSLVPGEKGLGYVPELDGIRAIAVLLVIGGHLNLIKLGGLGVDIFFVLSGYLITSTLLSEFKAEGRISLKRFYLRRALRLLPALVLLLVTMNTYAAFFYSTERAATIRRASLGSLLYVANWMKAFGHDLGVLSHLWSLSIEEQFYLLWPVTLVLLLMRKLSVNLIVGLMGSVILVIPVYRFFMWQGIQSFDRIYNGLDTRADALLIGCVLSLLGSRIPSRQFLFVPGLLAAAFLAYVVFVGWPLTLQMTFGGTLFALGVAIVLAATLSNPQSRLVGLLRVRPLVWIGRLSYGLYLWQSPIISENWFSHSRTAVSTAARIVITFLCATLSYYLLERPCLSLKKKFGHQATLETPA